MEVDEVFESADTVTPLQSTTTLLDEYVKHVHSGCQYVLMWPSFPLKSNFLTFHLILSSFIATYLCVVQTEKVVGVLFELCGPFPLLIRMKGVPLHLLLWSQNLQKMQKLGVSGISSQWRFFCHLNYSTLNMRMSGCPVANFPKETENILYVLLEV